MEIELFGRFREIAHSRAGIKLAEGKESLVSSRIAKRMRELSMTSPREYLERIENDNSGAEMSKFIDVMTTNFTSFMREEVHFEQLRHWARLRRRSSAVRNDAGAQLRLWSVACSTGQEPYSLAIQLLEEFGEHGVDFKVLATDISSAALAKAKGGAYSEAEVGGLSHQQLSSFFSVAGRGGDAVYTIQPSIRKRVVFARMNLSTPPFVMSGPFDAVLCRNVMIYFDREVRQGLISEIERLLAPGGIFMTGHSESLGDIRTGLTRIRPSVYAKSPSMSVFPSVRNARC